MTLKSLVAAGLLAASSLAMAPEAAVAKTNFVIGVGGYPCWGNSYIGCGYGNPYYPRRSYYGGYPYAYGGYPLYDDDYYNGQPAYRRISCNQAAGLLLDRGYYKVKAKDCTGSTYSFRARKNGHNYLVSMNSRTGRIIGRSAY